jgi:quinol monooxygenase YgiN
MICVIATIEVVPGRREEFLGQFRAIIPKVRAEEGSLEYSPMIDVATSIGLQPPSRENVVTVVEKWQSVEALENHLMAPHMVEYRKVVKSLVVDMQLRILEPA